MREWFNNEVSDNFEFENPARLAQDEFKDMLRVMLFEAEWDEREWDNMLLFEMILFRKFSRRNASPLRAMSCCF